MKRCTLSRRYTFNRRHWEGLFGTGGWVEEPEDHGETWSLIVFVEPGSKVIVGRNGGTFCEFGSGVMRDHEWTEVRVVEAGS
jgi:hypothetical protein